MAGKPRQRRLGTRATQVYKYIVDYKSKHDGNTPTIRNIVSGTDHHSPSTVVYDLEKLADLKLITREHGSINVIGSQWLPPINAKNINGYLFLPLRESAAKENEKETAVVNS